VSPPVSARIVLMLRRIDMKRINGALGLTSPVISFLAILRLSPGQLGWNFLVIGVQAL
jgi:hypothetical protein